MNELSVLSISLSIASLGIFFYFLLQMMMMTKMGVSWLNQSKKLI